MKSSSAANASTQSARLRGSERSEAAAPRIDVFFVVEEPAARPRVLAAMAELRRCGLACDTDYAGRSVKGQMTQAGRTGARTVVVARAADVVLKERRRLVLLPREAPLNLAHLRNMVQVTEMGGIVFPPVPAFYHRPQTIMDIIHQTIGKALDQVGVEHNLFQRWNGHRDEAAGAPAGGSR